MNAQKRQQKLQRKKDMFAQMRQELETNRNRKKKAETKKPFNDIIERLELAEKRMFGEPVVIDAKKN